MSHIPNWSEEKRRRVAAEIMAAERKWHVGTLIEGRVAAFATCRHCRRIVPLDLRKLAEVSGPAGHIGVIEMRLRCGECKQKGALIGLVWPETGAPLLRLVA